MSYIVNFTDSNNKAPITVYDNTSSVDTSLTLPGRNVTGYGQTIAENFLHILENFAGAAEPINPVEGQMWYNSIDEHLMVWDNTSWKAASGVRKSSSKPDVSDSNVGELWIDTTNQQLKMFTGTRWLLVGPTASTIDGLLNGPTVEQIVDTENVTHNVIIFYIADIPIIIFSKATFVPKLEILGYSSINAGININSPAAAELNQEFGNITPKMSGIATSAESLRIADVDIDANKFMRIDTVNTTVHELNIRNNNGITIGSDGNLRLLNSTSAVRIYNSLGGSSIDLQVNRNGLPDTILRISDDKVGINNISPTESLDVTGNILTSGTLTVSSNLSSSNLESGSFVTNGGAAIAGNLILGDDLSMGDGYIYPAIDACDIIPRKHREFSLGATSLEWKEVRAKEVRADNFYGVFNGSINGTVTTSAQLEEESTFKITGDVESNTITFTGSGSANEFTTTLTSNIIVGKPEPIPNKSKKTDQILTYRVEQSETTPAGLYKQSRDAFIGDLGVPLGSIMPYAGVDAPYGYLLCDGGEVEQSEYPELYAIIGSVYNGTAPLAGIDTFRLPDLRGRFAMGRDNMDNNTTIPTSTGPLDAGGGSANRIGDIQASTLGGVGGSDTVTLETANLPDHTHDMKTIDGVQFAAIRVDSAIYAQASPGFGPTSAGGAQYFNSSGKIKKQLPTDTFSNPVGVVNPFLTINYIIRSGPAASAMI